MITGINGLVADICNIFDLVALDSFLDAAMTSQGHRNGTVAVNIPQ